jgi:regulator of sirC expression with transglutaminase-like and TPR domain
VSSVSTPVARLRFEAAVRTAPGPIDLEEACWAIAVEEYPRLDLTGCRQQLARLGDGAREAVAGAKGDDAVDRLRSFLFEKEGFRGNTEAYDDPRNSFLPDVLHRRTGLPITLSILTMEVARAADLPMLGIGLPGHFVVRTAGDPPRYVDPFNGGRRLTEEDCQRIVEERAGAGAPWERFLEPVAPWRIVVRMLTNLKAAYLRREEHGKAVAALERLLALDPGSPEGRDLGLLYLRAGCLALAHARLASFVAGHPTHPDAAEIARHLPGVAATAFPPDRFVRPLTRRAS